MATKEKEVWAHFKKRWPYHSERQEPGGGFDSGKPDVLVQDRKGVPGLIELKAPTRLQLRPSQWIWHERWLTPKGKGIGGKVCVISCEYYEGDKEPMWCLCPVTMDSVLARRLVTRMWADWDEIYVKICKVLGLTK